MTPYLCHTAKCLAWIFRDWIYSRGIPDVALHVWVA